MQKYSWKQKKQENTEQGEPGSYERLIKPLHGPTCIQFEQSYTVTRCSAIADKPRDAVL